MKLYPFLQEIEEGVSQAIDEFGPTYNSLHECYGVLQEEVDEFFEAVRMKTHGDQRKRLKAARAEALDTATVAVKILLTIDAKLASTGAVKADVSGKGMESTTREPAAVKPQEDRGQIAPIDTIKATRPKDQRRSAGRASSEGEVRSLPAASGRSMCRSCEAGTHRCSGWWNDGRTGKKRCRCDVCKGKPLLDAIEAMGRETDVAARLEEEVAARDGPKRDPMLVSGEDTPSHYVTAAPNYRPNYRPHDSATCQEHPACKRLRGEKVPG